MTGASTTSTSTAVTSSSPTAKRSPTPSLPAKITQKSPNMTSIAKTTSIPLTKNTSSRNPILDLANLILYVIVHPLPRHPHWPTHFKILPAVAVKATFPSQFTKDKKSNYHEKIRVNIKKRLRSPTVVEGEGGLMEFASEGGFRVWGGLWEGGEREDDAGNGD